MFFSDQPIKSNKDDLLSRSAFAKCLGDAILKYKRKESIVLGLYGAWGSGKTSLINMAFEHIKESSINAESKPIIIKFNPWNFSDQNQLISQFFKQLSATLKRKDYGSDAKKAGKKIETYSKFFEPFKLVPGIGQYADIAGQVIKTTSSAVKNWGEFKENDLEGIRSDLNALLEKQPHKILIIMDDIDRLNNSEIRQIFQLVKSLGNFPNTIYLLAFDKKIVINALRKVQEGSGSEYLEKVIQIPFEIPLISREELETLLFTQLEEITKVNESNFDNVYWGNIYHSGLKYFFKNIRDVTRYINSVSFSFEILKEEINIIDSLAITGIQVFCPTLYYAIRDNKDIFAGIVKDDLSKKDQSKKICDEIITKTKELPIETLKDFLQRLFPKLESYYHNHSYDYEFLNSWRRNGRICSPDIFDIYFKFSIPKNELSKKEIETILSFANSSEKFSNALLELNKDERIIKFLERLEDYTKDIENEKARIIINVLMNIGDIFPEGETGFFQTGTSMRILRLFYQLSNRFEDQKERFELFKNAIIKAEKSLYTIVDEIIVQGQQHGKFRSSERPLDAEERRTVNFEQLIILESLASEKIEFWANDGRLQKHEQIISILRAWKDWGHEEKVKKFIDKMICDDTGLIDFITGFLSKMRKWGISDYIQKENWYISIKNIKKIFDTDINEIEKRIRQIHFSSTFDNFNQKQKLAIQLFLDTLDGKIQEP